MINKPKRLESLFSSYASPVYFITAVTANRAPLLATHAFHEALRAYALANVAAGRVMGRYVIMPDHLHCFVRLVPDARISDYVRWLKTALTRALVANGHQGYVWQPGFFDHVMRSRESYAEKWDYVRMNPVRAGLVSLAEQWPFQGEIERIEM